MSTTESSDMSRDMFIKMMIEELEKQQFADSNAFEKPPSLTSSQIFKKLCYDFPSLSIEEYTIFRDAINKLLLSHNINNTNSKEEQDFIEIFSLNHKLLDNLIYLSGSESKTLPSDNNINNINDNQLKQEIISDICGILYMKLPLYLLECNQLQISNIFCDHSVYIDVLNSKDGDSDNNNIVLLPWFDICRRFHKFALKSTISLVTNGVNSSFNKDSNINTHLEQLIKASTYLKPNSDNITISNSNNNSMKFVDFIQITMMEVASEKEASEDENDGDDLNENYKIIDWLKNVWVHLVFLSRDLLIHFSDLIEQYLPLLCESLLPSIQSNAFGNNLNKFKIFPNSSECLFVLVCSSIACGISDEYSIISSSSLIINEKDDNDITINNKDSKEYHEKRKNLIQKEVRIRKNIKARGLLIKYLEARLLLFTDICDRMYLFSSDGGAEVSSMLGDIMLLYFKEAEINVKSLFKSPAIIAHTHDSLITSRALSILIKIWIESIDKSTSAGSSSNLSLSRFLLIK
jgi:hypothetical protein